jgi:hypothetical protein
MTRLPTKILSRSLNDDGTLSLFIDIRELGGNEDFKSLTTDPVIDIQQIYVHLKDEKLYTLELRVGSWSAPGAGEGITLAFEPPRE